MVNLELLNSSLKKASPANVNEKNTSDEYFDKIVTLIEKEKINEAASIIEGIFAKGNPDIRLIVYYYYAYFTNFGIKAFIDILPGLTMIINDYWEILRPFNRKEKQVQNSLNWLFTHVLTKLKYCEKIFKEGKIHPIWKKSTAEITIEEFNQIVKSVEEFKNFFFEKWPKSPTKDRLLHLVKKIDDFESLIVVETPLEPTMDEPLVLEQIPIVQELTSISVKEEEILFEESIHSIVKDNIQPMIDDIQFLDQRPIELVMQSSKTEEDSSLQENTSSNVMTNETSLPETSTALFSLGELEVFTNKLKVFESLIAKNDYLKAAIVAKDIEHWIENFDPISYFPKLFSNYYFLFSKHITALSEQFNNKESLQIKSLEKLYRVDQDRFINW